MTQIMGMPRLPGRRTSCLAAALTLALSATAASGEAPVDGTAVDLTYRIYGGGLLILSLDTRAEFSAERYTITSDVATEGLVDRFFHGRMSTRAHGLLTDEGPQMQHYAQAYKGRFGERSIDMTMTPEGTYEVEAEPDKLPEHAPVDPKAVVGTVDPLTASIYGALTRAGQPCVARVPVFDGRRVYDLDFSMLATDDLEPRATGEFAGEAWRCKVVYTPKSGFTRDWHIRRAKDPLRPATVWLARFEGSENGAGERQQFLLPVRLQIESAYFNAVAHLTRASIDGRELIAGAEDGGN